jgi:hypothetical protein
MAWRRFGALALVFGSFAAAGAPASASVSGACEQVEARAQRWDGQIGVTVMLAPGRPSARTAETIANEADDEMLISARYGGARFFDEVTRAAVSGAGASNDRYAKAQQATAQRCFVANVKSRTASDHTTPGDAFTATAQAFEVGRPLAGRSGSVRVIVSGAGFARTAGADLAKADLSSQKRIDAVVRTLAQAGLLAIKGGAHSELVFADIADRAGNGLVVRQRQALFGAVCKFIAVTRCRVTLSEGGQQ